MNPELRMWSEDERVTSPAVTVVMLSLAVIGAIGVVYGPYEVAVSVLMAIAGIDKLGALWEMPWVARLDAWFEPNVAERWLVMRDRWREAAGRQLGRTRLIARVSSAWAAAMFFAIGVAIVAGVRVPAEGAAPVGLIVAVVFNVTWLVAWLSVSCHLMLRIEMHYWDKAAATPLSRGAVQPAAEVAHQMQCDCARRARSVLWFVAIVAGAAVAL